MTSRGLSSSKEAKEHGWPAGSASLRNIGRDLAGVPLLVDRLHTEPFRWLSELALPFDDLVIAGSAPLYIRGLRDGIADLDVVARGRALDQVLLLGAARRAPFDSAISVRLMAGRLEVTDAWFKSLFGPVDDLFERAEKINGLRFLTIDDTVAWKYQLNRPKDQLDLLRLVGEVGMLCGSHHAGT
jgi:hypothetical protein